jgi:hypothetical protein
MQKLAEATAGKALNMTAWGFDPALAIAIRFAIAEALVTTTSTGYQLSEKGKAFIIEVLRDQSAFANERKHLTAVGKDITEAMVDKVAKGWESA